LNKRKGHRYMEGVQTLKLQSPADPLRGTGCVLKRRVKNEKNQLVRSKVQTEGIGNERLLMTEELQKEEK